MANIEEKVESLIKQDIEKLGYNLYDVEYVKVGKDYFLRIYIDKSRGISLEDCEIVTNAINDTLDKADYIKQEYFLEVSSPGIERVLRKDEHLKGAIGEEAQIKLFKPLEGKKDLCGKLVKFDEESIYIKVDENEIKIERKQIAQIKTKYNWE